MDNTYHFYGSDTISVHPINPTFKMIVDQRHLYDLLSDIWCEYSCTPRLRKEWSTSNKTCGQCTITALLVQDIFGGEIYGVYVDDNIHSFSKVGDTIFDLTSEQFPNRELDYSLKYPQSREDKLSTPHVKERYLYLVNELKKKLNIK